MFCAFQITNFVPKFRAIKRIIIRDIVFFLRFDKFIYNIIIIYIQYIICDLMTSREKTNRERIDEKFFADSFIQHNITIYIRGRTRIGNGLLPLIPWLQKQWSNVYMYQYLI